MSAMVDVKKKFKTFSLSLSFKKVKKFLQNKSATQNYEDALEFITIVLGKIGITTFYFFKLIKFFANHLF